MHRDDSQQTADLAADWLDRVKPVVAVHLEKATRVRLSAGAGIALPYDLELLIRWHLN